MATGPNHEVTGLQGVFARANVGDWDPGFRFFCIVFELPDGGEKRIVVNAEAVREKLKAIVEDEDLRKYIL